ncbi:MAG: hypothetical protein ACFCUE_06605 [Candidatus Bathyarchaeia archaeon]
MLRFEAVKILKEMLVGCNSLEGKSVKLMPPDADSVQSVGYQIHVQKRLDGAEKACIIKIAQKHSLSMHDYEDFHVIYKPL